MEDYSLYDEFRRRYVVRVDHATAQSLNYDSTKSARMLKAIKAAGVQPVGACATSKVKSKKPSATAAQSCGTVPKPRGGKGATEWGSERTESFLTLCQEHRSILRQKQVPIVFWQKLSGPVSEQLARPYTGEQLRDKMKALKQTFSNMKRKGLGPLAWEFYDQMKFLFDDELSIDGAAGRSMTSKEGAEASGFHSVNESNGGDIFSILAETGTHFLLIDHDNNDVHKSILVPVSCGSATFNESFEGDALSIFAETGTDFLQTDDNVNNNKAYTESMEPTLVPVRRGSATFNESFGGDALSIFAETGTDFLQTDDNVNNNKAYTESMEPTLVPVRRGSATFNESFVGYDLSTFAETGTNLLQTDDNVNNNKAYTESMESTLVPVRRGSPTVSVDLASLTTDVSTLSETNFGLHIDGHGHSSTPKPDENETFRSPPKKLPVPPSQQRTPKSTPRRRKNSRRVVSVCWSEASMDAFLKECLARKEIIQSGKIPPNVWHEINDALTEAGHSGCGWQACRERYTSVNNYFSTTMLKAKGMMFGKKWLHYDILCQIHDIPRNYEPQEVEEDPDASENPDKLWDEYALDLLVTLYKERRSAFNDTKSPIRHATLFNEIASCIENLHKKISAKQCKEKIGKMLLEFGKEFDKQKGTGASPSKWEWYKVFLDMEKGRPTLNPPYCYSVGASAEYRVEGQKTVTAARTSKARPPAVVQEIGNPDDPSVPGPMVTNIRGGKTRKPLFQNKTQQYQDAKLETDREMLAEIRLWRQQQGSQGPQRTFAMQDIAASLRALCPPRKE